MITDKLMATGAVLIFFMFLLFGTTEGDSKFQRIVAVCLSITILATVICIILNIWGI